MKSSPFPSISDDLAIAIAREPFREHDDLVTLLTRSQGIVKCHCRGSRKPDSRISPYLQPLLLIRAEFMPSRSLTLLKRAELAGDYTILGNDPRVFQKVMEGMASLFRLILHGEPEERIFNLLVKYLEALKSLARAEESGRPELLDGAGLLTTALLLKGSILAGIHEMEEQPAPKSGRGAGARSLKAIQHGLVSTPMSAIAETFGRMTSAQVAGLEASVKSAMAVAMARAGLD